MSDCDAPMQVLGAKRKNLAGFSTASAQQHQGCAAICSAPVAYILVTAAIAAAV